MPNFIENKCPICNSNNFSIIGDCDLGTVNIEKPKNTKIVKCKGCKTIYTNPLPIWTKEDFSKLYNSADNYFSEVSKSYNLKENVTIKRRFKLILHFLQTSNHNYFEIGAGIHALMAKYLNKHSWNVTIQEPSDAFVVELKKKFPQFCILNSDFLDINEQKKYSLIYSDSVFEHVYNPGDYIKKCASMLEPGGILYFISPNEHSFENTVKTFVNRLKGKSVSYLCPYTISFHLLGFSKKSIKILAKEADLELVKHIRKYDYEWRHILGRKKNLMKYPYALLLYLADLIGWGTNQEIILKKNNDKI